MATDNNSNYTIAKTENRKESEENVAIYASSPSVSQCSASMPGEM